MLYNPMPIIITIAGLYLLFRLRGFFILHPIRSFKGALRTLSVRENFRSFTLALAGTLGVGNVLGVAVGIILGGAGSLFWLSVSSVFSAVLKYAEVTLAADSRDGAHGGMFYSVRASYVRLGGALSVIYALACLSLGVIMGAALQSHSVVSISGEIFDTPPALSAILLVVLVLFAVVGGGKFIARITAFAIPVSTIIYILLTIAVIALNYGRLPEVVGMIISEAFSGRAVSGGVIGFILSAPVREGYSRGVLSNEAGAGTSTIAHATGGEMSPAVRGILGILEVIFDTVILCMLSGLAILTAIPDPTAFTSGALLILTAVTSALGSFSGYLLFFAVLVFAYSTIVCWYYYAEECVRQLFGRRMPLILIPIYIAAVILGVHLSEGALVYLSDILLLVLVSISVPTLIKNSDRLVYLSERSGLLKIK